MKIIKKISLDLAQSQNSQRIDAVQGDTARFVELYLYNGGAVFVPPNDTSAVVSFRKQDGTGGMYDTLPDETPAYEISGNVLTVALAPQVLTSPGEVDLSVGVISGGSKLYTFVVFICVQPNPGMQAVSDNYFKIIGALPDSGWEPNKYLGTDSDGKVVTVDAPEGGGIGSSATLTAIDLTNFESGTFTETVDGSVISHTVTFDASGRPTAIDDVVITWGDA